MPHRALAGIVVLSLGATAAALPGPGAALPRVDVDDVAAGRARALPGGHPVLVMYEDKDAQTQNEEARRVLGKINDVAENRARFEFVAVADVAAWNWWPAKRYVLADLKQIAQRDNTTLYADWTGAVKKAWGLTAKKSTIVLVGGDGKVRFAGEGTLSKAQLAALVRELAALGCRVN